MRKVFCSLVSGALLMVTSSGALAWGCPKLEFDDKTVKICDIRAGDDYGQYIIEPKDVEHGVYLIAMWNLSSNDPMPNTTKVIRDYMASKGFKIVEKREDASMVIRFSVDGVSCDTGFGETGKSNFGNAALGAGVSTMLGGSQAGFNSFMGSNSNNAKVIELKLDANIATGPDIDPMSETFHLHIAQADMLWSTYNIKGKNTPEQVLKIMVDQWIEHYAPAFSKQK